MMTMNTIPFILLFSLASHLSSAPLKLEASFASLKSDANPASNGSDANPASNESDVNSSVSVPFLIERSVSHFSSSLQYQNQANHIDSVGPNRDANRDIYLLPHNISIVLLKWHPQPSIRVSWSYDGVSCEAFRIIYHPITSRYRYIIEVPCYIRNVTIERLIPSMEYVLTINPVPLEPDPDVKTVNVFGKSVETTKKNGGKSHHYQMNAPNVIRFISPQTEYNRFSKFRSSSLIIRKSPIDDDSDTVIVKTGELCVVIFVLCGWLLMIFIFIKKWGKIRGIETVATLDPTTITRNSVINQEGTASQVQYPFSFLSNQRSSSNHSSALNSLKQQRSKDSDEAPNQCVITGCPLSGSQTIHPTLSHLGNQVAPNLNLAPNTNQTCMDETTRRKLGDAMSLFLGDAKHRSHRYSHGDIHQGSSLYNYSNESYQEYPDHDINCVIELGLSCNCKKCRINSKGFLSPTRRTSWALLESIPEKDNGILNDSRRYKSAENLSLSNNPH